MMDGHSASVDVAVEVGVRLEGLAGAGGWDGGG